MYESVANPDVCTILLQVDVVPEKALLVDHSVSIIGACHLAAAEICAIDGKTLAVQRDGIFSVTGSALFLEYIKLLNGEKLNGGALYLTQAASVKLMHCILQDNQANSLGESYARKCLNSAASENL